MASPAEADAPAPAPRDADSGRGTQIALGAAVFVLIVLLVLPGFLAAGFSRAGAIYFYGYGNGRTFSGSFERAGVAFSPPPPPSAATRVALVILAPANWLIEHSQPIRRFYLWQYRLCGGYSLIWQV